MQFANIYIGKIISVFGTKNIWYARFRWHYYVFTYVKHTYY